MIDGGPGWSIDPVTLLAVITDESAFRDGYGDDPALEALVALWSGEPEEAEVRLAPILAAAPDHWRWRALRADIRRDQDDLVGAIADYEQLLAEHVGTGHEATLSQHLGKVHFVARDFEAAAACFERALLLRTSAAAEPSLVESSRAAARAARAAAEAARAGAPPGPAIGPGPASPPPPGSDGC